jgi:hypothetical protein
LSTMAEWLAAFWKIIYKPLPQTFLDIAQNAKGKFSSCIAWLVFVAIFSELFNYIFFLPKNDFSWLIPTLASVVAVPIEILFYVFWIRTFQRKVFHGETDYYNELLYVIVAIYVVMGVMSKFLALIPILLVASTWIAYAYFIILTMVAVRAITKLDLWKTIVTVLLSFLLAAGVALCVGICLVFGVLYPSPGTFR